MRYNGNNKEIKDAILKENQPYLYGELNRLTKLELLDIIQSRDERTADERDENMFHGIATITVILNDIKKIILDSEKNYSLVHLFNSNFSLDSDNLENLPIGLFGEFYNQNMTFFLIESDL